MQNPHCSLYLKHFYFDYKFRLTTNVIKIIIQLSLIFINEHRTANDTWMKNKGESRNVSTANLQTRTDQYRRRRGDGIIDKVT